MSDPLNSMTTVVSATTAGLEPTVILPQNAAPDTIVSQVLDNRYRIDSIIGRGAMGAVYAGHHILMDRQVAIKVLLTRQSVTDDLFVKLFRREAVNTCKVDHPNAITVHDFLFVDNTPYMIMEYVHGETLRDVCRKDYPLPLTRIYGLFAQICSALAKTHSVGLIHRDLKLDNIMVVNAGTADERVKVLDFGIAALADAGLVGGSVDNPGAKMVMGTPVYMSPEQIRGETVDARCDVYALGVILYILLAKVPPFLGPNNELYRKHQEEQPPPLPESCGDQPISAELSAVVMRALEKEPDNRFESVLEFMGALKEAIFGKAQQASDAGQMSDGGSRQRIYTIDELLNALGDAREYFARGDYLGAFNLLDVVVKNGVSDPKIIHLAVLSLAQSGATTLAADYFEQYREHLPETEDFLAIEARLLRDRFTKSRNADEYKLLGTQARNAYLAIYRKTGGYYTAINAATLSFLIEDFESAKTLAVEALRLCEAQQSEEDYWLRATQAEASLLLGQYDDAASYLQQAKKLVGSDVASLDTTRRQLKRICEAAKIELSRIQLPDMPRVIHYTGRMINGLGSNPGIDPDDVGALELVIADVMERENVRYAYGSLACGADLLLAEAALARNCELTVVLPFEQSEFLKASVSPAGKEWESRFERVLEAAHRVKIIPGELCDAQDLRFRHASSQAMGMAQLRAAQLDSEAVQFAVYTEQPGVASGLAGTAADIRVWNALGLRSRIIDAPAPRRGIAVAARQDAPISTIASEFNTVIVATVANTEASDTGRNPIAADRWLRGVSRIVRQHEAVILSTSLWANSVCIVTHSFEFAPFIAASLLDIFEDHDREEALPGFGVHGLMHSGITYGREGILGGQKVYFGVAVNTATTLDVGMLPGAIYATEDCAAHYALIPQRAFQIESAGEYAARPGEEKFRMYCLKKY